MALDANVNTFFDSPDADGAYVGIDHNDTCLRQLGTGTGNDLAGAQVTACTGWRTNRGRKLSQKGDHRR